MIEALIWIVSLYIIFKYWVFPLIDDRIAENARPDTEAEKQHKLERKKEQRGEFIFLILLGIVLYLWISSLLS
tara:strand:- start:195 stop:413 length:219 start_codon:yes stop_codon:yes gene_type:complete